MTSIDLGRWLWFAALVTVCVLLPPLGSAQQFAGSRSVQVRQDALTENYLVGYFVWNAQGCKISWDPAEKSEDPVGPVTTCSSAPLPRTLRLNVTRLIQLDLYYDKNPQPDVELYADKDFLAGAIFGPSMYWKDAPTARSGFVVVPVRMHPEVALVREGQVLEVRLLSVDDARMAKPPEYRIVLRLPFYSAEEDIYRFSNADQASTQAGSEGGAPTEAPPSMMPGALAAALSPFLGLALAGRRRRFVPSVVFIVSLAAFSGCIQTSPNEEAIDPQSSRSGEATIRFVDDADGLFSATGNGTVMGVVRDDLFVPLGGVHVALLGTSFFSETGENGRFLIRSVPPAAYTLHAQRSAYQPFEHQVQVKNKTVTQLEIMLRPIIEADNDFRLHRHDYWGDAKQLPFYEGDVGFTNQYGAGRSCVDWFSSFTSLATGGGWCQLPIGIPSGKLVLPGTASLQVEITWSAPPQFGVDRVGVGFLSNHDSAPGYDIGHPSNVNTTVMYPKSSGTVTTIQSAWEMTDVGHQKFTTWRFFLFVPMRDGYRSADGLFHVKITLQKGSVPLEPAHRDFWGGNSTVTIIDNKTKIVTPSSFPYWCYDVVVESVCLWKGGEGNYWASPRIVPPETVWLEVRIQEAEKVTVLDGHLDWGFLYKGAQTLRSTQVGLSTAECPSRDDPVVREAGPANSNNPGNWSWRVGLTGEEPDAYYSKVSLWCFWVKNLSTEQTMTDRSAVLGLQVIAHRTPMPTATE